MDNPGYELFWEEIHAANKKKRIFEVISANLILTFSERGVTTVNLTKKV